MLATIRPWIWRRLGQMLWKKALGEESCGRVNDRARVRGLKLIQRRAQSLNTAGSIPNEGRIPPLVTCRVLALKADGEIRNLPVITPIAQTADVMSGRFVLVLC